MNSRLCALAASSILATLAAGCGGGGDGLPRQAVSGNVTLDGEPLKAGMIQFLPGDPSAKDATTGGAPIRDGAFSISSDVGLVPGRYKVSISSPSSEPGGDGAPGSAASLPREGLPAKYNTASTLTAEVEDGGGNAFEFPLTR